MSAAGTVPDTARTEVCPVAGEKLTVPGVGSPAVKPTTLQLTGPKAAGVGFGVAVKFAVFPPAAGIVADTGAVIAKGAFGSVTVIDTGTDASTVVGEASVTTSVAE